MCSDVCSSEDIDDDAGMLLYPFSLFCYVVSCMPFRAIYDEKMKNGDTGNGYLVNKLREEASLR